MANVKRLVELGMPTELAKEAASQIAGSVAAKSQIAALTAVSTPNASDPATVITLANANKVAINAIIAALKA